MRISKSLTLGLLAWIAGAFAFSPSSTLGDQPSQSQGSTEPYVLVFLGDSIAAGFGLSPELAPPSLVEAELKNAGYNIEIRNAGVSGDTTSGGAARLDWSLDDDVDGVLIELGGNDVLRAIDPTETKRNLTTIITALQSRNIDTYLAGMLALPNYGEDYAAEFNPIYPDLAAQFSVPLFPFILDGVAGQPQHLQNDGIHPNELGARIISKNLSAFLIENIFTPAQDLK